MFNYILDYSYIPHISIKFLSTASSLGAAITLPVCGFLIDNFGWESVFYVTGCVGTLWAVLWFFLVFDNPSDHPRISPEERQYIESAIGSTGTSSSHKVMDYWLCLFKCWYSCIKVDGYINIIHKVIKELVEALQSSND